MAQAARFTFVLDSIPVEVEYRNIKVMRLTVYPPDGKVRIAAPGGTAPDAIKRFAVSKIKWIEEQRKKLRGHADEGVRPELKSPLRNHSTVYLWGVPHKLELIERGGNSKITAGDGYITMYVRPLSSKTKKQAILDRWYRRVLKEAAEPAIKKWEALIGVEVKKLYIRKMKSHWGSCNYQKQTLRLNSELAKLESECLEYVIVHEMLHIIEKGHNRNFYGLLSQYIPDWKAIRKKMNSGGL